ncbi:sulfotransferase 1C2-like [Babylonia areolata]|uniref:sulfotransferase 1C2-like n=1 Tax=Babylonia areolata TaxID=304850 RepID=UPI003FD131DB
MATQELSEEAQEMLKCWEVVEGMYLPPRYPSMTTWSEQILELRQMTLRQDDVMLCAFPKTGTHWLWEVSSMLLRGRAEYASLPKEQLMMEFVDVKKLQQMPSPRILNTHLPFSMLPVQEMKAKGVKVLHVYRNPKDTLVSFYHMCRKYPEMGVKGFESFFDVFFSEKSLFGCYFDYLKRMNDFVTDNPDVPVLTVSFEDMKKNPADKVKELARFLELDVPDSVCEEIEVACRFDNMKKQAADKQKPVFNVDDNDTNTNTANSSGNKSEEEGKVEGVGEGGEKEKSSGDGDGGDECEQTSMFRKGQVGDWKNYLTVAMDERVERMAREKMEGLPFTFHFS